MMSTNSSKYNNSKLFFQQLSKTILVFFEHQEFAYVEPQELQKIFFENLSKTMQIAFDVNFSIKQLEKFTQQEGSKPDLEKIAQYLSTTLENENTYSILNYYLYEFIQAYLSVAKKDQLENIESIMKDQGLEEQSINQVQTNYQNVSGQLATI